MKKIIIILLGVIAYSCNKQVDSKEIILKELEKTIQDEIKVDLIFSTQTQGTLSIYRYNNQIPDTVINLSDLVYSEVFIDDEIPYYGTSIILNYLRSEVVACSGRFYIKVEFVSNVHFIMNRNYYNSQMTYGSNQTLLEPSTKTSWNTSYFENSFWVKYTNKPIKKQGNDPSY